MSEPLTAIASTSLAIAFSISPTTSSVDDCVAPGGDRDVGAGLLGRLGLDALLLCDVEVVAERRHHHRDADRLVLRGRGLPPAFVVVAASGDARSAPARRRPSRSTLVLACDLHSSALVAAAGGGAAPTIIDTSASWFAAVGAASPTVRPWRSTTARSATCATCSRLCEIRITATPRSGSRRTSSSTCADSRTPERGGRLVEDHEAIRERDRAQDRDRLPLAAGHQPDLLARADPVAPRAARAARPSRAPSPARAGARAGRASAGGAARARCGSWRRAERLSNSPRSWCSVSMPARRAPRRGERERDRQRRRRGSRRASSVCTPQIALTSVDLPAPLSPSSATISPASTDRLASSSARTAP